MATNKSWQCRRCFWSHPAKHDHCAWCKLDKMEAVKWREIPLPNPPTKKAKEKKKDNGKFEKLEQSKPQQTPGPSVKQQPTSGAAEPDQDMELVEEDAKQDANLDSAERLATLKEQLEVKEDMLKAVKSRTHASAKAQAELLVREIADLRVEINKHKPLRVRIKKLKGAVRWRSDRLEEAKDVVSLKEAELASARESVLKAQAELKAMQEELAAAEKMVEQSADAQATTAPASVESAFSTVINAVSSIGASVSQEDKDTLLRVISTLTAMAGMNSASQLAVDVGKADKSPNAIAGAGQSLQEPLSVSSSQSSLAHGAQTPSAKSMQAAPQNTPDGASGNVADGGIAHQVSTPMAPFGKPCRRRATSADLESGSRRRSRSKTRVSPYGKGEHLFRDANEEAENL